MEPTSKIDAIGRIIRRGIIETKVVNGLLPRRGKIEVVAGAYLRLSDGTIAGPMVRKNSNGDVFTWWGPRYLLPHADDEEATALGTVWLDGNGNAHSEPSPLDAVEVYDQSVFW